MQILGIQIDRPFLRAAVIDKRKNKVEICALQWAPLAAPENVKALYISSFKGQVTSGLSGKDLFMRSVELNIGKSRHLEQALTFQSEATSYFPTEDVIHLPFLLKKEKKGAEALLFTASRQGLKNHLEELKKIQIDPDRVTSWSVGLVRYIQWKLPSLSDAFLIDLGSSECTCVWMEQGEVKKSYTLDGGIEALLEAFWEDQKKILLSKELEGAAKQIDLKRLKSPDLPSLYKKLCEMQKELAKAIFSFHRLAGVRPIAFTGRIEAFHHLREFFLESFREAISTECNSSLPTEELKYAICIGLALDSSLQLLQNEFVPQKHWKRLGRNALFLSLLSLSLSGGILFLGKKAGEKRKEHLLTSLQTALNSWGKEEFSATTDPEEILEKWAIAVQSYGKEYPYMMRAPKVGEIFSWLSHHLPSFAEEGDPLQIKEIHYQLVEFPHIGSLKEPYRAKLELEFQVKSPMVARKFHEFLLKEEEWIDPSEEVSWEALSESYRTSFFLKNRSPHVL